MAATSENGGQAIDAGLTPLLWRCPGITDGVRCGSFLFDANWMCPAHMDLHPVAERYVAVRALYDGTIVTDETQNGDPLVLDLRTSPATVVEIDER